MSLLSPRKENKDQNQGKSGGNLGWVARKDGGSIEKFPIRFGEKDLPWCTLSGSSTTQSSDLTGITLTNIYFFFPLLVFACIIACIIAAVGN